MQNYLISSKTILVILFLMGRSFLIAQEQRTETGVEFRVNVGILDENYSNNSQQLDKIFSFIEKIQSDTTIQLLELQFCGGASPEGSYQVNRNLANQRLSSLEKAVRSKFHIPDSLITRNDSYIPWGCLKSEVEKSNLSNKGEVISIIEEEGIIVPLSGTDLQVDSRIPKLRSLDNGATWKELDRRFFSRMRSAYVVFVTFKMEDIPLLTDVPEFESDTFNVAIKEIQIISEPENGYNLYIKTNAIGLAAAIVNASVELDIIPHLSFTMPVYYSAWNYFKSTIKLRTLHIQPELRFWLKDTNQGYFAGTHFGLGYYNVVLDGASRYQDHNRNTPAIGGGIALGYRMPISSNSRWHLEFSFGCGVYKVHYDTFHNTPDTKKGLKTGEVKKTYVGPDQAAVSVSYLLPEWKKGGRK